MSTGCVWQGLWFLDYLSLYFSSFTCNWQTTQSVIQDFQPTCMYLHRMLLGMLIWRKHKSTGGHPESNRDLVAVDPFSRGHFEQHPVFLHQNKSFQFYSKSYCVMLYFIFLSDLSQKLQFVMISKLFPSPIVPTAKYLIYVVHGQNITCFVS